MDREHHEGQRHDRVDRHGGEPRAAHLGDALHPARRVPARHQLRRKRAARRPPESVAAPRERHEAAAAQGDGAHHSLHPASLGVRRFHQREGKPQGRGGSQRMTTYKEFHRRSMEDRENFWAEEAKLIHWRRPFQSVLDYSRPPFARWFVGGQTNLCHNAVDRHLAKRGDQKALVWISTEVDQTRSFTYRELHSEVNRVAAMVRSLGVKQGDRMIIYMPMI